MRDDSVGGLNLSQEVGQGTAVGQNFAELPGEVDVVGGGAVGEAAPILLSFSEQSVEPSDLGIFGFELALGFLAAIDADLAQAAKERAAGGR